MTETSKQDRPYPALVRKEKPVRALGICSGGLDSILSGLVLRNQGVDVAWVNFETPFFSSGKARRAARLTGIPLTVKNITKTYIDMLRNPRCGYGANMNPCLDCHALMFRLAADMRKEEKFDFLFSGEVVGQRPMSQTKPSLRYVEKHSGAEGYILRPLSARLLLPTIPEQEGLVDRERLLDISGRGRKRQIELAASFGITDYPAPAGGCLLTDKGFSRRLRDLFDHQDRYPDRDLELLKYGRHLRIDGTHKIIVGRTKTDNDRILNLADPSRDMILHIEDIPGPVVLIPYGAPQDVTQEAASICAAYSNAKQGDSLAVSVRTAKGLETITVTRGLREKYARYQI